MACQKIKKDVKKVICRGGKSLIRFKRGTEKEV
jgi:hypothetical protein